MPRETERTWKRSGNSPGNGWKTEKTWNKDEDEEEENEGENLGVKSEIIARVADRKH